MRKNRITIGRSPELAEQKQEPTLRGGPHLGNSKVKENRNRS
jgi:hypothetical protein